MQILGKAVSALEAASWIDTMGLSCLPLDKEPPVAGKTRTQRQIEHLNRTWKPRTTQPPVSAGVRSMACVWYWLQMAFDAEVADDLLLVERGTGGCLEAAFRMTFDDYGRTGYGRKTLQNVAKTR